MSGAETRGTKLLRRLESLRPGLWMLWLVSLVHLMWGTMLLFSHDPFGATPLSPFASWPHYVAGVAFLVSGAGGMYFSYRKLTVKSFLLLVPQQLLVVTSGISSLIASITGKYADGVLRPRLFIGADQMGTVILAVVYSLMVLTLLLIEQDKATR